MAFARLVTHYVRNDAWLEDGALLRGAASLDGISAVLVHGRLDLQSPLAWAWDLWRRWRGAELVVVDGAGHAGDEPAIVHALARATDRFAARR
jgi:proline iminopeptidase